MKNAVRYTDVLGTMLSMLAIPWLKIRHENAINWILENLLVFADTLLDADLATDICNPSTNSQ
ncbi:hypothetical protein ACQFX9_18785 [Aliinostoc sp. HNIBRCY26]|uniref:hypothetical protein n=1 Tax=Aliinostoc sp. HNIBRCY26 TaxID=3418997 RepID=UPI003D03CB3C